MSHEIENINKEREIIEKNEIKVLELNNTMIEIKNSLEGLNRYKSAEGRISQFEDR